MEEATSLDLNIKKSVKITLDDILTRICENEIPIVLLDWNVILKKEDYAGHYVVVVGYTKNNVIIHNEGIGIGRYYGKYVQIEKNLFDQARKHETGECTIFIQN